LTDLSRTDLAISNWRAMLRHGWEAGDLDASAEAVADAIEARLRTGRPLAAADWITRMGNHQRAATGATQARAEAQAPIMHASSVYCPRNVSVPGTCSAPHRERPHPAHGGAGPWRRICLSS
jgi:hypothetical protein